MNEAFEINFANRLINSTNFDSVSLDTVVSKRIEDMIRFGMECDADFRKINNHLWFTLNMIPDVEKFSSSDVCIIVEPHGANPSAYSANARQISGVCEQVLPDQIITDMKGETDWIYLFKAGTCVYTANTPTDLRGVDSRNVVAVKLRIKNVKVKASEQVEFHGPTSLISVGVDYEVVEADVGLKKIKAVAERKINAINDLIIVLLPEGVSGIIDEMLP